MSRSWVIGSRASALAQVQTRIAQQLLRGLGYRVQEELSLWVTEGDRTLGPLWEHKSGKSLFVSEIQQGLRDGVLDIAVHSLKDLSLESPSDLVIAGIIAGSCPSDALVARSPAKTLWELSPGSRIGTSSLRRCLQLHQLRPDCAFLPIRGNVGTRLEKLQRGEFDALILATAGLQRLGLSDQISQKFDVSDIIPAFNQGLIGLECRSNDHQLRQALQQLTPPDLRQRFLWERHIAQLFNASCQSAVGVHAQVLTGSKVRLFVFAARNPLQRQFFSCESECLQEASQAVSLAFDLPQQDWSQCAFRFS